ncbi:MAG TPA: hypothetical protein VGX76_09765, partial [Pirellulales bacterium]|nr:hypothetical protein [Pirellulales bacterium]
MENPYQSPHDSPGVPFTEGGSSGLGGQIRIVAILLMVQGGMEILMAVMCFVLGGVMPAAFAGATAGVP